MIIILKQNLFQIIKIPTSKIQRKKKTDSNGKIIEFNLGEHTYKDAKENNEIVSVGDNLVFHKIREYNNDLRTPIEIYNRIHILYKIRDNLKKDVNSKENSEKLNNIQDSIINELFVKDIINIEVINKKHYKDIAINGFIMNGIKYKQLCCGSGQLRRDTVTFVNESLYDYLMKSLMCGVQDRVKKMNRGKFSAYFALSFSSAIWVTTPRICVIPDYETTIPNQSVDYINSDSSGKKYVIPNKIMDIKLNSADGMGLISPQMSEVWSQDIGLNYNACQFIIRSAFVKGCLSTFDFSSYAKQVCGVRTIKSIYGEEFDVDDIDIILTESMFKMHQFYNSCKEYEYFHRKNNLKWGVSRYNKLYDDDYSLLNYQYIQNNNLSNEDISNLLDPTINWFKKICSGDLKYSLLYSTGCKDSPTFIDNDENFSESNDDINSLISQSGSLFTKVIIKNSSMFADGYIQKKLYDSIKESFRKAKIGRVWVHGNYQFMVSDPIPLLRNVLGLSPEGLIPANHIYSNYWNLQLHKGELDLCRSPMVDRHEHNIVNLINNSELQYWYQYLYSGIIYSIYDTGTVRASDAD